MASNALVTNHDFEFSCPAWDFDCLAWDSFLIVERNLFRHTIE